MDYEHSDQEHNANFLDVFPGVSPSVEQTSNFDKKSGKTGAYDGGGEPLGNNAKYVRHSALTPANSGGAEDTRRLLYKLQRGAVKLLPQGSRQSHCRWTVQRRDSSVEVHLGKREGSPSKASYAGLQTCGSVWLCPCCSEKISRTRAKELNHALMRAREMGFIPLMVTLTARHDRHDLLAAQLHGMKKAKQRMRRHRAWANMKASGALVGTITATEVTWSTRAGWHTHFHEIWFLTGTAEAAVLEMIQRFRDVWITSLEAEGLDGIPERAFQAQGASAAGDYVGKWGAAEELALKDRKKGNRGGRTPTQLLHDATLESDTQAAAVWQEYAREFRGKRQLVWSNGLKDLFGIEEVADGEAAELEEMETELVALISHESWTGWGGRLGARWRRVRILEAAEKDGTAGVLREAGARGTDDDKLCDTELIEPPP